MQKLAYVGLSTKREVLEWWKANTHKHQTWVGVKEAIKTYYGNYYQADWAYNEIVALKQTSTIHQYLNDIDQLNTYTGMTDHHLSNIILNGITSCLCLAIGYCENLCANLVL